MRKKALAKFLILGQIQVKFALKHLVDLFHQRLILRFLGAGFIFPCAAAL